MSIPADCQLDPLQPNHHHNHYEQNNHQAHHSLLQSNGDSKIQIGGGLVSTSPTGGSIGMGVMDTSTLRSNTQSHHRQSPQIMGDPPEGDDTDPDVIPNQYGKFLKFL